MGKTQIALEYAYRHALEYSAVFWIEAETSEQIVSSLLRIAELVPVPERPAAGQQRVVAAVQHVVAAVQHWLATHSHWLLIWDNLDDLELLPRFLPSARDGALLLTTRRQALGPLARGIELGPLPPEDGLRLVLRRARVVEDGADGDHVPSLAGLAPSEAAAAGELVEAMEGLPLALDQAGAYIEETGCRLADYLQHYQQQRARWLDRRGLFGSAHPHSVSRTFRLIWQRVQREHPAAAELLGLCAFLQAEAIPEDLFLAAGSAQAEPGWDAAQLDQAIALLRAFSLVQRQPATRTWSLHRLVQVVLQAEMSEQERGEHHQRAVRLLNAGFPEVRHDTQFEPWGPYERLLPHVLACAAAIPPARQDRDLAELLLKAGWYVFMQSQSEQGALLCQRALRLLEELLGPDHLQVATALHCLAMLAWVRGEYERAVPLCQRALQIREQGLGPEHPQVAFTLLVLALLALERGQLEQAERLFQRSLSILEQALGPEHPDLARPLNNLAELYRAQGRYEQALPLALRAVQLFEGAWGPEHPLLGVALDTVANLYRELDRPQDARPVFQRVLHLWEQGLGPEHPWVATALGGLALLCRQQGTHEEAAALFQRALALREQRLGPHHPETAHLVQELAIVQQQQGHLTEARALAERALSIRVQALGEAHPQTQATRALYAQLLQQPAAAEERAPAELDAAHRADPGRERGQAENARRACSTALSPGSCEGDPVQAFLAACCELHPRAWCRAGDLWRAYERWAADRQERYPLSRRAFIAQLKAHGCRADRTKAARIWRGIALVKTAW